MARDCRACSKPVPGDSTLCPHCGARQVATGPITAGIPTDDAGPQEIPSRPGVSRRYLVVEEMEHLGTARVYRAIEKRSGTEVALRLLSPSMVPDAEALDVLRGALTGSRGLEESPRIVRILGVEREESTPYLVTEVFNGRSLADRLKKERVLPDTEALAITLAVAEALRDAHARAVLHAELRPASIVLGLRGDVRVTDFAISRELSRMMAKAAGMDGGTRGGFYRAPEAASSDVLDRKSDLYALGCILFEMATGTRELPAEFLTVCARNPMPGTAFPDPCGRHPEIPERTAKLLRVLLAPNPRDRFNTAEDLVQALGGGPFDEAAIIPLSVGHGKPSRGEEERAAAAAAKAPKVDVQSMVGPPLPEALAGPLTKKAAPAGAARALKPPPDAPPPPPASATMRSPAAVPKKKGGGGGAKGVVVLLVLAGAGWGGWTWWQGRNAEPEEPEDVRVLLRAVPGLVTPPPAAVPAEAPSKDFVLQNGRLYSLVDGAELVAHPGGEFMLGEEGPEHGDRAGKRVTVPPFLVDRHEVTVGQWKRFAADGGEPLPPQPAGSTDTHPVVGVTWAEANAYARWAGRRLPTEAEWECMARGTAGRRWPWGAENERRRWNGPGEGDPHEGLSPAGALPDGSTPEGVLDLAGNAWEWCSDFYLVDAYASAAANNPKGPPTGTDRVVRGGSHLIGLPAAGAPFRNHAPPDSRFPDLGFRCVK